MAELTPKEVKKIQVKFGLLQDERLAAKKSMTPIGAAKHAIAASEIAEDLLATAFGLMGIDVYGN